MALMPTCMPTDASGRSIPVLRLRASGAQTLPVSTSASSRTSRPFLAGTRVISVYATVPMFLASGDANVSASQADHFLPEGTYVDLSLGSDLSPQGRHDYLAAVALDTNGQLYISERE